MAKASNKITRFDFISMVYLPLTKKEIKDLADRLMSERFPVETIYEIASSPNAQSSFHSSLVLEAYFSLDKSSLDPVLDELCGKYNEIEHYTTARTFAKILTTLYRLKEQRQATDKMLEVTDGRYDDKIIDGCFRQLQTDNLKISVALWQLQLLTYFMNKKNAWIKDEVYAVIEKMRQNETPGVKAFTAKYLNKIKNL
ncbi:MAG: hypothetical protein LBL74_03395 [Bacteroidales bacterium]|jgi:hypothetical protein|nr:hypothetical protein [Bacteroidales bacterium]